MLKPSLYLQLMIWPVAILALHAVDVPVALFIQRELYANAWWADSTGAIPDALLLTVCVVTAACFAWYLYASRKRIESATKETALLIACALPISFAGKAVAKLLFGRANTRDWLLQPHLYGYHWFAGGGEFSGFPSGHMAVFTALAASAWRRHPCCRLPAYALLLVLAAALVTTNYHFVSDVVAGSFLGLLVEATVHAVLCRQQLLPYRCNHDE